MSQKLEADLEIGAFGLVLDGPTRRIDFPRGEIDDLRGISGNLAYGAREVVLERLHTRLDSTHWQAHAASAGHVFLRTDDGALELVIERIEMPHGVTITRAAEGGVELLAPHAMLGDVHLHVPDLSKLRGSRGAEIASEALVRAADVPLRAEKLRWLDTLKGEVSLTLKVVLDLPLVGKRTLDQDLKIPIDNGSLDFRALDKSLDWLEGAFVDLGMKGDKLLLSWRVPIVGSRREIVSWQLDPEARALATFDRVPLRSLADYRLPGGGKPDRAPEKKKSDGVLRSLTLQDLKVNLAMVAPRQVEIGQGAIQFGGDDQPGIVGLELHGSLVHPPGPGGLTGEIGVLDITAKDVPLGSGGTLTVDRLHLGDLETFEVTFDGFRPVGLTARVARITASNLSLRLGSKASAGTQ